jgi:Flp pilus assembly protein TadB
LENRIVETSLRFSVLSRFTAFVAVDRSEVVNTDGKVQRITQPVEAPAGWPMFGADSLCCIGSIASPELQRRLNTAIPQQRLARRARPATRIDSLVGKRNKAVPTAEIFKKSAFEADFENKSFLELITPNFPGLRRIFEQADCQITANSIFGLGLLLGVLATTGTLLIPVRWFFAPLVGLVSFFIPYLWVLNKRRARLLKFAAQLPDALELVTQTLRAGHSLGVGMHAVAEQMPAPIANEFERVYEEHNLRIPIEDSMHNLCQRVPNLHLQFLATSVVVQRQTGPRQSRWIWPHPAGAPNSCWRNCKSKRARTQLPNSGRCAAWP